jgi:hypothetical protein
MKDNIIKFIKKYSKELIIAFVLAIVAAVLYEYLIEMKKEHNLKVNLRAVALIITFDKEGKPYQQGSGLFISNNGKLVTNYHVLKGADFRRTLAKLPSGAYYQFKGILGIDDVSDIAILQFDAKDTPSVKGIGDSDKIKHGDNVVAIGAPLGLAESVSEGVISNPKRQIAGRNFIQFTAAISSGSSGGGLFGKNGKTLGVVTASINPDKSGNGSVAQNINLAVPINVIKDVISGSDDTEVKRFTENSQYFYSMGIMARNAGRMDESIRYFKKAIAINDKFAYAYIDLGITYSYMNQFEEELSAYEKAAKLDPTNADAFYFLGTAYENLGLYDKAVSAYQRALAISPKDGDIMYALAVEYLVLGEKDKAALLIAELSKINPGLSRQLHVLFTRMK